MLGNGQHVGLPCNALGDLSQVPTDGDKLNKNMRLPPCAASFCAARLPSGARFCTHSYEDMIMGTCTSPWDLWLGF